MKKTDTGSMSLVSVNSFGLVGFWFGVAVAVYLVYE